MTELQTQSVRPELDESDRMIVEMLVEGLKSKEISRRLDKPLSTVQRRIRNLFDDEIVSRTVTLNYQKLGLKKGEFLVYLKNGNLREVAGKLAAMRGIIDVSVHIGNSDVVGTFMYNNSAHLLDFISAIRDIDGVDKVVWSEEVYNLPTKGLSISHILRQEPGS